MTDSELLDINQAAAFLKVSITSLRRWTNSGQLPCLRVGNRRERRFRKADLLAFMETSRDARLAEGREHTLVGGYEIAHGAHLCGWYEDDKGLQTLVAPFLQDALRRNAMLWVIGETRSRRLVQAAATTVRVSMDDAAAAGRLIETPYADTCEEQIARLEGDFFDAERRGVREMRVIADARGFKVSRKELTAYEVDYERHLSRRFPVVTLCLYDVRFFKGGSLLDALKTHHDSFDYPPRRWLA